MRPNVSNSTYPTTMPPPGQRGNRSMRTSAPPMQTVRNTRAGNRGGMRVQKKPYEPTAGDVKNYVGKTFTKWGAQMYSKLMGRGDKVTDNRMLGEMHGLLELPNGKYAFANYMGPGTQVLTRLKRGDKGMTPVDKLAKIHDIDYALATTPAQVREADAQFIAGLEKARNQGEKTHNIRQGQLMVPKAAYERLTGKTLFNDLKGPGPNGPFLKSKRRYN
jgi:hypothetical protein